MAINSNIALGVEPIKIDSPLNSLAQIYQIKSAQQAGDLGQMKMDEYQRDVQSKNTLRDYFKAGDQSSPDFAKGLGAIDPKYMQEFQKSQLENKKMQGDIDKTSFDNASKSHSIYQNTLGSLAYSPNLTKDAVVQAGQGLVQAGVLKPEVLQQQLSGLSDDPVALKAQLLQGVHAQLTPEQLLTAFTPKPTQMDNGQSVSFRDTNPNSPTYGQMTGGAAMPKMQSPDSVANNNTTMRGQNMLDSRSRETNALTRESQATTYDAERGILINKSTGLARPATTVDGQAIQQKDKALTDGQSKAVLFGSRMQESNKILNELSGKGTIMSIPGAQTEYGIGSAVNFMSSEPQQQLEQAKRDFINAVLRRESGATIQPIEFDGANKQYFPQPGEGAAVQKQKANNRAIAIRGMQAEIPPAQRDALINQVINGSKSSQENSSNTIYSQADAILKGK